MNFGMHFNTIKNNNLNSQIDQEILSSQNNKPSKKIYLSGNGLFSTLKLFEPNGQGDQILNDLRNNQWIINEANLVLYIDQEQYSSLDQSQFRSTLPV